MKKFNKWCFFVLFFWMPVYAMENQPEIERPKTPSPQDSHYYKLRNLGKINQDLYFQLASFCFQCENKVTVENLNEKFSSFGDFCLYLDTSFGITLDDIICLQENIKSTKKKL